MYRHGSAILLRCAVLIFAAKFSIFGAENRESGEVEKYSDEYKISEKKGPFEFIPSTGLMIEGEIYGPNRAGFTGAHRKSIDIEVLRYRSLSANFIVHEETILSGESERASSPFSPFRIRYEMDYIYLAYNLKRSTIGLMLDHICHNMIDYQGDPDPFKLRWYGAGLRWESYGMKPGQKDFRVNFNPYEEFAFLNHLHYRFHFCYPVHTEEFPYDALLRGEFRWDILRYHYMIPYTGMRLQALIDERIRIDREFEAGLRFRAGKVNIIPYGVRSYTHDVDLYNGISEGVWKAGLRIEGLLGESPAYKMDDLRRRDVEKNREPHEQGGVIPGFDWPRFRFAGGYSTYLDSKIKGSRKELDITLDLLSLNENRLFLITDMTHSTCEVEDALYPRYMHYSIGAGFEMYTAPGFYSAFSFFRESRHDGNHFRGTREYYDIAGITLSSEGKRRGIADSSIHRGDGGFVNRINWKVFAGYNCRKGDYPYNSEYSIDLRWDVFRFKGVVAYTSPEFRYLYGDDPVSEYSLESGIRFGSNLAFVIYHSYIKETGIDRIEGAEEHYHKLGVRVGNWL